MATETHPSSSSSSDNYDVFLSFRGEDTRGNFTDHLYTALVHAGIQTFRDNEELHHGEEIGPKLLKSIEQSRISIPIFSKNYASSKWCLQELIKIMECKKTCGQIVLPIFYKVEPSHVRNQTGHFKKAFLKHKKEQRKETVRAWRKALKEAANLKGWDSEDPDNRYETNLINYVVERALSVLSIKTNLQVAEHPTGIDSHVKEVERMLDFQSEGVQFVGIHGMGGIGKTTTAKAVFNTISNQFESRRFLEDVREKASQYQGLVNLQKELVSDLFKGKNPNFHSVSSGIDEIKKLFRNKKVLIVLDDVDQDEQLRALAGKHDWFGSGSRIIITTRDKHILRVDQVDKSKIYKPKELDEILSLQLFSKHAFGRYQPPQEFMDLSKKVVSILGGLPLAIEVVGSLLRDEKEHMVWEDTLKKLEGSPQKKVQEQLKISYTRLDLYDQKLFLDIACFFIGVDIESVIPTWQACGYFPRLGIKVLVDKSLVKIDNDNKLRMHDQLRDMGREIVRQENPQKPGKRSRLWSHKEALEVLKEYKGTGKVEGLFLDFGYQAKNHRIDFDNEAENYSTDAAENYSIERNLLTKAFEKMSHLRLLQVGHAYHDGNNFGHLPQGIKWLSLKGISCKCVPTISHLKKLAVLDLSGSDITNDWGGWQQIQSISTLKVLDLSRCRLLESTPHFSCDTSLERLILDRCIRLSVFHESIEHLQELVFLSLNWCNKLKELPDSICKLSSIKSLILFHCFDLEKLPNLSDLKNLQALCLSDCSKLFEIQGISGIPELQQLDLENCRNLKLLPELPPGLIKLNIGGCTSMERLPNLSTLKNLKELRLNSCHELAKIEDINGLTMLHELNLRDCRRIQSLAELPSSLIKLDATDCGSIKRLPNLSNLKNLQALLLCGCRNMSEIQGISGLSLLQQLDLKACMALQSLPEMPPSFIRLDIRSCESLERLPNLLTLKHLKEFSLDNCCKLAEIEGIDELTLLQKLDLSGCRELQSLPELPSSLIELDARNCFSIERLANLSNLTNLQVLHLCCRKLSEIQDISGLSLLKELDLQRCTMLQSLPGLPPSLKVLRLDKCMMLTNIQSINDLTLLQELDLKRCSRLQSLSGLPSSLTTLNVDNCKNLFEIQGISDLSLLQKLCLDSCPKLQSLPKLPSNLISLYLKYCNSMEKLPDLSNLKILESLHLASCGNLTEIQGFSDLSLLQTLRLNSCRELQSLDLSNLRILEIMCLNDCDNLTEIRGLESLESLIELQVRGCYSYVKTLPKSVAKGSLPIAFNEGKIYNKYPIPDDDNIKGTSFYFVYQYLQDPASSRPIHRDVFSFASRPFHRFWRYERVAFSIEAEIQRNDGIKRIKCYHDLRIEGMDANTDKYGFYSCYFQGLSWFGFPLKKRDIIRVTKANLETSGVQLKMLDLVMEYDEAMEDSQQLEKRVVRLINSTTKK